MVYSAQKKDQVNDNEMQPWSDARSKSFVILTSAVSVV